MAAVPHVKFLSAMQKLRRTGLFRGALLCLEEQLSVLPVSSQVYVQPHAFS